MNFDQLLSNLRKTRDTRLRERGEQSAAIGRVRTACERAGGRNPTETEAGQVRAATERAATLDAEIHELDERIASVEMERRRDVASLALSTEFHPGAVGARQTGGAVVTYENRTYSRQANMTDDGRDGVRSFFVDAFRAQHGDMAARGRLERHSQEAVTEGEVSDRATSTTSFGGLVVPQYLVDQAALLARAGRPVANSVTHAPLPAQGMTLAVPRGTTGASVAVQASKNTSVSSTDEVWADITLPVATVAGQQDVSRQSLERGTPGIDSLIYTDLAGAHAVAVDGQVLSGSGSAGQVLGILNTAGINQATAFIAAATIATFYGKVAGQISAISTARFIAPDTIAMHPRRGAWLENQFDSQGRPLVVPGGAPAVNSMGSGSVDDYGPGGTFLGLKSLTDASLPTAVGSGPEDQVLVYRAGDLILFEDGDGTPNQLKFEQTLGNQLTVKLVVYSYIAFTAARYPAAVGVIGGNSAAGFGLVAPTF